MVDTTRPAPRNAVISHDLDGEIVVVDPVTNEAHVLSGEAAEAWRAGEAAGDGMSRRDLLRRAGTVAVAGSVITIAMPEVIAAASTVPPVGTVAFLEPDQTTALGQPINFTVTVLADDSSIPTGTVTVTDPDKISGVNGSTKTLNPQGKQTFSFTAPATMPATNPDVFTLTYVPSGNYTTATDTATVTFVSSQTKATPSISFSTPNTKLKTSWTLTVTVAGSVPGHAPTGTIGLTGTVSKGGVTITPASQTLTTGANSTSTATFTVQNPGGNKPKTVALKATYTPASGELYYNGTSQSTSYVAS